MHSTHAAHVSHACVVVRKILVIVRLRCCIVNDGIAGLADPCYPQQLRSPVYKARAEDKMQHMDMRRTSIK